MREHLGDALSNGFALLAESVELGAVALGFGEARTQHVIFLQQPTIFFCSFRLIGAQPRNDVHQKFDLVLESIDGIEIDSARDCLLCHPYRLTYRGKSSAAQIVAQMGIAPEQDSHVTPASALDRSMRLFQRRDDLVHRGLHLDIGQSSVR
jgi:hypothetical protein